MVRAGERGTGAGPEPGERWEAPRRRTRTDRAVAAELLELVKSADDLLARLPRLHERLVQVAREASSQDEPGELALEAARALAPAVEAGRTGRATLRALDARITESLRRLAPSRYRRQAADDVRTLERGGRLQDRP